jgi:hypothetical protein
MKPITFFKTIVASMGKASAFGPSLAWVLTLWAGPSAHAQNNPFDWNSFGDKLRQATEKPKKFDALKVASGLKGVFQALDGAFR